MDVELPDGTVIEGVPDGTSKADLAARLAKNGYDVSRLGAPSAAPKASKPPSLLDTVLDQRQPVLAGMSPRQAYQGVVGALRGAKDVIDTGAHAIAPAAEATRIKAEDEAGRAAYDAKFGASDAAQGGRLVGQGLVTLPIGGALGQASRFAGASPRLVSALSTSGMTTGAKVAPGLLPAAGDLAIRSAAGATVGGASMAAIDPSSAGTGAVIGAVLPPALRTFGVTGQTLAKGWRAVTQPRTVNAAEDLANALGVATPEQRAILIEQLKSAPELITHPTVAQALQTPEAGILQRVVHDSPGGKTLRDTIAAQASARTGALEQVAPTSPNGLAAAQEDLGRRLVNRLTPERADAKANVNLLYQGVDPENESRLLVPKAGMQSAFDQFLPRGTFGSGKDARTALQTAETISPDLKLASGVETQPATFQEVQALRSSIGEKARDAARFGRDREAAALFKMRDQIDAKVKEVAEGGGQAGENFLPDMVQAWRRANAAHAEMKQRFDGPLGGMFRSGQDGEPVLQGAALARRSWGDAENVQAFRRLVGKHEDLLGEFKSMVTTEGASTSDAAGNLTTKFSKWVEKRLPGLKEAFTPHEVAQLQKIAADIDRAAAATKAGTSLGGSNTYQNAANALSLGLLDSPALNALASRTPIVGRLGGMTLDAVRGYARNAKAERLAELLADAPTAANALAQIPLGNGLTVDRFSRLVAPSIYRGAPRSGRDR